jgi:hypothetical protein
MIEQHTPGPWKMGFNFTDEQAIIGKDGAVVADASWTGGSGCELSIDNPADEKLIVAAPELLEVVKQMQSALSRCFGAHAPDEGDRHRALATASATIAKARGEAT